MTGVNRAEMVGDLRARWRRWTEMVRLVALRQGKRYAVEPKEYGTLHAGLLELCRTLASQSDAAARPTFEEIEDVLVPWANHNSLIWADREIVYQLLDRCRTVQWILDGRPARRANWGLVKLVLTVAVAVAVIVLLWSWATDQMSLAGTPSWVQRLARVVNHHSPKGRLLVGGMVATLLAIAFVWRSARRS